MITEIKKHFDSEYPKEGCGVIVQGPLGREWIPCKNISENSNSFVMDSKEFINISRKNKIIAIVHNHIEETEEPSIIDINNCNIIGIPYYIFSYPDMKLYELTPEVT